MSKDGARPNRKDPGELSPRFKFWATLWNIFKIAVISIIVLAILCGIRIALWWLGFTVSFERVFAAFTQVLAASAWPLFILIGIYLFKDNLGELADAFGKALHGNSGEIKPSNGVEDADVDDEHNSDGKVINNSSHRTLMMFRAFEKYALDRLQQEEGVLVQRQVRVFDSDFRFDGAFEKGDFVYGVEVKMRYDKELLRRFLLRVNGLCQDLRKSQRKRFRMLVCILMNDGERGMTNAMRQLGALRDDISVPVEFRFYPFNYGEQQKVKA